MKSQFPTSIALAGIASLAFLWKIQAVEEPTIPAPAPATPPPAVVDPTSKPGFTGAARRIRSAVVSIEVVNNSNVIRAGQNIRQGEDPRGFRQSPYQSGYGMPFEVPAPGFGSKGGERERPQGKPEPEEGGRGSGFVIAADGHILTNLHVVKDAGEIRVSFADGEEYEAVVVGSDPRTDLAVLKIEATDLPVVTFGNSDSLEVGESVIAVGSPFGLTHSVTSGIVSAVGRTDLDITDLDNLIQTDASVNPGNSGGPLVNYLGEVVGVNVAIYSPNGGNIGLGFAVPSNAARNVAEQIVASGKVDRGFLGIKINDGESEEGAAHPPGAVVQIVEPGSAAAVAGILVGDRVLSLNGHPIRTANDLRVRIADARPGERVSITIHRDGSEIVLEAALAEMAATEAVAETKGDRGFPEEYRGEVYRGDLYRGDLYRGESGSSKTFPRFRQ